MLLDEVGKKGTSETLAPSGASVSLVLWIDVIMDNSKAMLKKIFR
jgi:hypothetical protein